MGPLGTLSHSWYSWIVIPPEYENVIVLTHPRTTSWSNPHLFGVQYICLLFFLLLLCVFLLVPHLDTANWKSKSIFQLLPFLILVPCYRGKTTISGELFLELFVHCHPNFHHLSTSFWMAEISPCSSGKFRKSRGKVSWRT